MAVWLVRAGGHGEYEGRFFADNAIYLTWEGLSANLAEIQDIPALVRELGRIAPGNGEGRKMNHARQIWKFAREMTQGDLVVMPSKSQPTIAVGRITGVYENRPQGPDPYFHRRTVQWLNQAIPRTHFGQDLLYSFGAFLTICRIQRNNAEQRMTEMANRGWGPELNRDIIAGPKGEADPEVEGTDLERAGKDQILRLISARFKGKNLEVLVEAIFKAKGYTTYLSPEGPDGGRDILAGNAPMGFGGPKLCIEVKSGKGEIDRPTVDKLIGAIKKFNADQAIFVAWDGYKTNVQKELANTFFEVRLWTADDVLEELVAHYDKLDEDIRAKLPLKQIWVLADEGDS